MYGIQKNSTDEPICKADVEKKIWTPREEMGNGINWEIGIDKCTAFVKQIASRNLPYNAGSSVWCSMVTQIGGRMGMECEGGPRGRGYMNTYS